MLLVQRSLKFCKLIEIKLLYVGKLPEKRFLWYNKYMKKEFPYQIHIVLGIIWISIGVVLHSGIELAVWVGGGLVMIVIGLLNRRVKNNY